MNTPLLACEPHPNGSVPVLLDPYNATPRTRTPWGGTFLAKTLKQHGPWTHDQVLGELWELSVEPSFPSRITTPGLHQTHQTTLRDAIQENPSAWLGDGACDTQTCGLTLLVKTIDAADNLSVQVHPQHNDPALGSDESGKSEAWMVLHAQPGAGLYIGWASGVTQRHVAACIASGGRLDALMNFVEVEPGQVFYIPAGTPHAIGAGVVLCEVQHVTPGKRAITYRFWDWNRLYSPSGHQDPTGSPRELHIERALACTSWDAPRGPECLQQFTTAHIPLDTSRPMTQHSLIACPWFEVSLLQGSTAHTDVLTHNQFLGLLVLDGEVKASTQHVQRSIPTGSCLAVPASTDTLHIQLHNALVVLVRPSRNP